MKSKWLIWALIFGLVAGLLTARLLSWGVAESSYQAGLFSIIFGFILADRELAKRKLVIVVIFGVALWLSFAIGIAIFLSKADSFFCSISFGLIFGLKTWYHRDQLAKAK